MRVPLQHIQRKEVNTLFQFQVGGYFNVGIASDNLYLAYRLCDNALNLILMLTSLAFKMKPVYSVIIKDTCNAFEIQ